MSSKENLIGYLLRNGRDLSWLDLSKAFGYASPDAARKAWSQFKQDNPGYGDSPHVAKTPSLPTAMMPKTIQVKEQYTIDLEDKVTKFEEDLTKGTAQVEALVGQEIKSLDELVAKCNIDLTKWEVTKYIQNFWNNRYQVKAFLSLKQEKNMFQEFFIEFLKTYSAPAPKPMPLIDPIEMDKVFVNQGVTGADYVNVKGCLIINKQDLHFDKYDINGSNAIHLRFRSYLESIDRVVKKAELSYMIEDIIYILGSDQFNCEWTGMTTKGTPQKNMIDYHNGFAAICDHEVEVIQRLAKPGRNIKIIYIPGNHDEYVGWHMITWLATYFRSTKGIEFDVNPSYTKCLKYGNSAMMFNHGDVMKPEKLAGIFPQVFKDQWSTCDYQYIFTGDRHYEKVLDVNGIMFYQLTQGSNATSSWDSKHGYKAKGFLTAFVISEGYGIADQYHERL